MIGQIYKTKDDHKIEIMNVIEDYDGGTAEIKTFVHRNSENTKATEYIIKKEVIKLTDYVSGGEWLGYKKEYIEEKRKRQQYKWGHNEKCFLGWIRLNDLERKLSQGYKLI